MAWAEDIVEEAHRVLDSKQAYITKMSTQYANQGFKDDGHSIADYTISDIRELRKMLADGFSSPKMKQAKNVIDQRSAFGRTSIEKSLEQIHRNGLKWDSSTKKWVKK